MEKGREEETVAVKYGVGGERQQRSGCDKYGFGERRQEKEMELGGELGREGDRDEGCIRLQDSSEQY